MFTDKFEQFAVNYENEVTENSNTREIYKNSTLREIRADLEKNRSQLINVCMNLTKDLNKASMIRANNAFLGQAVFMVGKRRYNRRGTVGTHLYENVYHAHTLEDIVEYFKPLGYTVFAVDNVALDGFTPENIWDVKFPEKSIFVYGEEQRGLSEDEIRLCDRMVYINQTGSVRSLNVSQAGAVIMSEYSRQHRL